MKKIEISYNKNGNPTVWLTWAAREVGLVELRAVSLTRKHHDYSLAVTKEKVKDQKHERNNPHRLVRAWGEERDGEHLYGIGMTDEVMALASQTLPRVKL